MHKALIKSRQGGPKQYQMTETHKIQNGKDIPLVESTGDGSLCFEHWNIRI
jgi:hypothetical protein